MKHSFLSCPAVVCLALGLVTVFAGGCASTEPRFAQTTGLIEPGMRAFAELDARLEILARQRGWSFIRLAPGAAPAGSVPPGVIYRWTLTGGTGKDNQPQTLSMELLGVDVARPMKPDERRVIVNGVPALMRIRLTGLDINLDDVAGMLSDPIVK